MPNHPSDADPRRVLKTIFGFDRFRPLQEEIIQSILGGRDTLAIMPTGGGKSICFQIPALIFPRLTVVVSPLISLMKDQVDQLRGVGVPAVFLNSSLGPDAYRHTMAMIRSREARLLYIAPETLLKPSVLNILAEDPPDCLAIDEAHCISEWGHDFRPEYRRITEARERFPNAVCAGFTATATPRVRKDIKNSLGISGNAEFIGSFDRKNLFIRIAQRENALRQTLDFIARQPDSPGVIYCTTRQQVDDLCGALARNGHSVAPYHAGLNDGERTENQERFIRDDVRIVVATVAFGMGIDKPDIRFVLHLDLPKNIETYYQQIGRAGRDGLRSECLLLFSYGDIGKIKFFVRQKEGAERKVAFGHLDAMIDMAESDGCRREPLLAYFGEALSEPCGDMCDNCVSGNDAPVDLTVAAQKFLSCVKRSGEIFGAQHIIDVLRGSKSQKILQNQHDQLSTHGIGREHSSRQWFFLSRQFLRMGLMIQDERYGSLKLTEKAWRVFRAEEKVTGRLMAEKPERPPRPVPAAARGDLDFDAELFDRLRKLRKRLADDSGLPPYAVFPDRTLMEMSALYPVSDLALRGIHGVGEVKLVKYGPEFMTHIAAYCREKNIQPPDPPPESEYRPAPSPAAAFSSALSGSAASAIGGRHIQVGEAFNAGATIPELSARFGVLEKTIVAHLERYMAEPGVRLRVDGVREAAGLEPEREARIMAAFQTQGVELLKPVYEALGGREDYDTLRLGRLLFMNEVVSEPEFAGPRQ